MFSLRTAVDAHTAKQMNPVVLAFVGDAVYSLYVREKLCLSAGVGTGELQRLSVRFVSAHGQNEQLERIRPLFTAEEEEIFRRGRNAKKGTRSKSATLSAAAATPKRARAARARPSPNTTAPRGSRRCSVFCISRGRSAA